MSAGHVRGDAGVLGTRLSRKTYFWSNRGEIRKRKLEVQDYCASLVLSTCVWHVQYGTVHKAMSQVVV